MGTPLSIGRHFSVSSPSALSRFLLRPPESWPKRQRACVAVTSGCPGDHRTSLTMDGTTGGAT